MNNPDIHNEKQSTERRQHSRFCAGSLKVMVKSLRNRELDWEKGLISSVDFNRFGIGLQTSINFTIGDILQLIIRTDDNTVAEVNGLVCNRTQIPGGYRFGIRFENDVMDTDDSPEAMINISEEILMIEREAAAAIH